MKKVIQWVVCAAAAVSLILILLITSFEVAIYYDNDYSYYQKEYEKYQVTDDLNMEMSDVMFVTEEMMAYLRGDREELSVITTVGDQEQDFFNEQDRFHMKDVQVLFLKGLSLRFWCILILIVCLLILLPGKKESFKKLCRAYWISLIAFFVILGILAVLFATDFSKYFTIFHEIFFSNDLWMFDPNTDLMIRMLPEGFFYDMATKIVITFGLSLIGTCLASVVGYRFLIRKTNKQLKIY